MNLKKYLEEHVDTVRINKSNVDFHKNPNKLDKINSDAPGIILYNGDFYTISNNAKHSISFEEILEWLKSNVSDDTSKCIKIRRLGNSNYFSIQEKELDKQIVERIKKKFESKNKKLKLKI